jgi:predicted RNA binding protein YcfA (HicA-like mRNA interferase family)
MPWSSSEIIRAVERHGYTRKEGKGRRGTHRVWARKGSPGELHNTVTIPLDKGRIPGGTLHSMLKQLGIDEATLRAWLDD